MCSIWRWDFSGTLDSLKNFAILFYHAAKKNQKRALRNKRFANTSKIEVNGWLLISWAKVLIAGWKSKGSADPTNHFVSAGSFRYFVLGQFIHSFINRHSPIDLIHPAQCWHGPKIINRRARSQHKSSGQGQINMNKFDLYEVVTQKIIDRLEAGVIPWQKPWKNSGGMPRNLVSGRPYNGINFWMLLSSKFTSPFYLTFEQALSLGGNVIKGEKSTMVVFWKILENEKSPGVIEKTPFLRYYNVFNLEQTEGIDTSKIPATEAHDHDFNPIEAAQALADNWIDSPKVLWGEDHACYIPHLDTVRMPDKRTFFHDEQCYSILFHELTHGTGHSNRTNRHDKIKNHAFGSQDYSQDYPNSNIIPTFLRKDLT